MQPFEYASPTTKEQAVKLLSEEWGKTEVMAGGTDLISAMKDAIVAPSRVVSLKHIAELRQEKTDAQSNLRVGSMVTLQELIDSTHTQQHCHALITAAEGVTSPQMRAMGTIGGDFCQRPRCWYYRAGYGLLAQQNGKPLVPDGDNRYHAILGNSGPAYFVNPSSFAPAVIAFGGELTIYGPAGSRTLEAEKFFLTPASENEREYALKPNEIVTEIMVPAHHGAKSALYEVRQKEALDWPLAAAAAVLYLDGDTVKSARIVLGHVAPVPWLSPEAAEALVGKPVNETTADEAGKAAVSKATPLSKNRYKVQLARVAVKRAILSAVGKAPVGAQGGAHA